MLSKTAQYALCAVDYLARHPGEPQKAREMAAGTGAPTAYLSTVLKSLKRAGILKSRPGPHGGYELNVAPEQLTMLDVVDASDPLPRFEACPLGRDEHAHALCPVHRCVGEATDRAREVLARTTIADLLSEGESCAPD